MKRIFLICFLMLTSVALAKPKVFFNYKVFQTPDNSTYITTLLQFSGGTFKYLNTPSGNLRTTVEITHIFESNDSIVLIDKYQLDSPEMQDSIVDDFFDIQHYGLDPGVYTYELIIKDMVSGEEVNGQQTLKIEEVSDEQIEFSDIEFIQSASKTIEKNNFVKNGFLLLPYMTNYFPPEMDKIAFYLEIYNADILLGANEKFLLTYSISDYNTNRNLEGIFHFQRLTTSPVVPVIGYLPIDGVPTGDFNLVLNIVNKENDTIASKSMFFQRRSDMKTNYIDVDQVVIDDGWMSEISRDSMAYFLGSIMPISPRYEYESIRKMLKGTDTTQMEKYFYAFWIKTSPENPQKAWYDYRRSVYYCEKLFGTQIKYAWETDRGRIWLKYGAPNQFIDRPNEPSAYPYQIWHYYRIGQRSNVRFIFYNPDLVTNDYPLLHSDMQGELQNYRWQNDLHKRDANSQNVDDPGGSVHYGGNANVYFNEIDR
ncbi:MAG: GWxTD domain-containing protein [Crocinitomicaceae bacterium]|nr:GWxTD domain-containing protein [Crocinitomicaceae bacterium]